MHSRAFVGKIGPRCSIAEQENDDEDLSRCSSGFDVECRADDGTDDGGSDGATRSGGSAYFAGDQGRKDDDHDE
jgi:hypothetical protein